MDERNPLSPFNLGILCMILVCCEFPVGFLLVKLKVIVTADVYCVRMCQGTERYASRGSAYKVIFFLILYESFINPYNTIVVIILYIGYWSCRG